MMWKQQHLFTDEQKIILEKVPGAKDEYQLHVFDNADNNTKIVIFYMDRVEILELITELQKLIQ